ncbi:alkene reductase [Pantoea agglomerans]|uniref:alkene reductase n=1 Tax=Enterobacter agglomerans TaxID=549 RepID=UPI002A6B3F4E|nr:alkene reductase [Pantoea agglomerans]MDY0993947.1 alkene reductase [Pantoea agglomerans]
MSELLNIFTMNGTKLSNRVVMAPMTRSRAYNLVPTDSTVTYYRQRATAGLIVSEGSPVSMEGRGQAYTPGIYTDEQIVGWKKVTEAVHAQGGKIFIQLWHVGRSSHIAHQPDGQAPVSSVSRVAEGCTTHIPGDNCQSVRVFHSQPRALATDEVPRITQDFVRAAKNAIEAGFDGVEIHAANGYIFEQFINGGLNDRTDRYGGNIANRLRFTLETVDAVSAAIGSHLTGIRIAPYGRLQDMHAFDDEQDTWLSLAIELRRRHLAYVHLSDQESLGAQAIPAGFLTKFREAYEGTLIVAGSYTQEHAELALREGYADLIAFGRPFIANPDLVNRMKNGWPIAIPDKDTFYTGRDTGYIDYPTYHVD